MGTDHEHLLLHNEVGWLSRGRILNRLYELYEEVLELLLEKKSQLAENVQDNNWLSKLAYVADMFDKLNTSNLSLQGPQTNSVTLNDKISAFIFKLKLWQERILNLFGVFPQLNEHVEFAAGNVDITSLQPLINQHLNSLVEQFQEYFGALMLATDSYAWICDPFTINLAQSNSFTHDEENELFELKHDHTMQAKF